MQDREDGACEKETERGSKSEVQRERERDRDRERPREPTRKTGRKTDRQTERQTEAQITMIERRAGGKVGRRKNEYVNSRTGRRARCGAGRSRGVVPQRVCMNSEG